VLSARRQPIWAACPRRAKGARPGSGGQRPGPRSPATRATGVPFHCSPKFHLAAPSLSVPRLFSPPNDGNRRSISAGTVWCPSRCTAQLPRSSATRQIRAQGGSRCAAAAGQRCLLWMQPTRKSAAGCSQVRPLGMPLLPKQHCIGGRPCSERKQWPSDGRCARGAATRRVMLCAPAEASSAHPARPSSMPNKFGREPGANRRGILSAGWPLAGNHRGCLSCGQSLGLTAGALERAVGRA